MLKRTIIILVLFILVAGITSAQGDSSNMNDPNVNEDANACYEGGTLEDKCNSGLMWQAGWYLIRFEYGLFERSEIPGWLVWVLPPVPEEASSSNVSANVSATVPTNCYTDGSRSFYFETGSLGTAISHVDGYYNRTCSTLIVSLITLFDWGTVTERFAILVASSNASALTQCVALFSGNLNHRVQSVASMGYNTPGNWYACAADGSGPIP